jgi:hypothetical protein
MFLQRLKVKVNNRSSAAEAAEATVAEAVVTAAAAKNAIPNGKSASCRSEESQKPSKAAKK